MHYLIIFKLQLNLLILGLKIITGSLQSNDLELVRNDINKLLKQILVKRWK